MYLEKHTIMYAYFCVRSNQICIIVITEVPAYPRTSPLEKLRPNSVSRIFLGGGLSQGTVPGIVPWDKIPSGKHSLQQKSPPRTTSRAKFALQQQNSLQQTNLISPYHHLTIDGNVSPKTDSPLGNFTINYNHYTI